MKRFLLLAIAMILLIGSAFAADDWTCPNCGNVNPGKANFCGSCGAGRVEEKYGEDIEFNAWVCSGCGSVCSNDYSFCLNCGNKHTEDAPGALLITRPEPIEEINAPEPLIEEYSVSFTENEKKYFTVNAEANGNYVVWITEAADNYNVYVDFYDAYGNKTKEYGNDVQHTGTFTRDGNLQAGQQYKLEVRPDSPFKPGSFKLHIGHPRQVLSIDGVHTIHDRFSYYAQTNYYSFTAPVTGIYSITCMEAENGLRIKTAIIDELNNSQDAITSSEIGMGKYTAYRLNAGEKYTVLARQEADMYPGNLGIYTIQIGYPGEEEYNITGCSAVGDIFYYPRQENRYTFTAPYTGEYLVSADSTNKGSCVSQVYDSLGNKMKDIYTGISNLEGGHQYTIVVENKTENESNYVNEYVLSIIYQE